MTTLLDTFKEQISSSYEETLLLGKTLAPYLLPGAIIALCGELGAGKTAFVRGLADGLGCRAKDVCSPTFSLLNIYPGSSLPLYHFDLYRLPHPEAFFQAGFDEYFHAKGICCIEWAEKIRSHLPPSTLLLTLSHWGETQRRLTLTLVTS